MDLMALEKEFLQRLESGRSINTIKNYKTDLECFNRFLKNTQNNLKIDHFTIVEITDYDRYLHHKYKSDNSRRRRIQTLRIFFDFLVEKQIFPNNPVRKLPTSPKFLDIPRPTSFIDIKTLWVQLLEESRSDHPMNKLLAMRNQLLVLMIYGAGLKVSDMSKLKADQLFIKPDEVRVLVTTNAKRDPYTVPLPNIFATIYPEYLQLLESLKKESNIQFDEVLFNANPYRILSGGLSARGIEVVLEELRKKLDIVLTPKSLRQACIFKWLHQRISESLIKEWLGLTPSYCLKSFRETMNDHVYGEEFLEELYKHYILEN